MAKKPTPVRVWFRTVMPGRRSCPSCGTKLPPGEEVWSLGQYVRGKWNTVTHFCRACFRARVQGLLRPGVVYEPVGYGSQKLPNWIMQGVADPKWEDSGPYEEGSLFDPEMKNPRHLTPAQKAAFGRWLAQARAKKRSNPMTRCSNPSHWHRGTHLRVRCNPASRFCVRYAGGGQAVYTTLEQALAAHRQSPGSTVYEQAGKQWVWRSNPLTPREQSLLQYQASKYLGRARQATGALAARRFGQASGIMEAISHSTRRDPQMWLRRADDAITEAERHIQRYSPTAPAPRRAPAPASRRARAEYKTAALMPRVPTADEIAQYYHQERGVKISRAAAAAALKAIKAAAHRRGRMPTFQEAHEIARGVIEGKQRRARRAKNPMWVPAYMAPLANPFTTEQAQEVTRGAKRAMLSGMKAERHLQDRTAAYDLGRSLGYTDTLALAGPTKKVRKRSASASMRTAHKLRAIVDRDTTPPMTSHENPRAPRAPRAPRPRGLTAEESLALAAQAAASEAQASQYYLTRARAAASDLGYAHGLLAPVAGYSTSRDVRDAAEAVMGDIVKKSGPLKAMDRGFYQNPQRRSRYLWHAGNYCVARAGRMCALYVKVGKRWKLLGRGDTLADCKKAVARMRRSR